MSLPLFTNESACSFIVTVITTPEQGNSASEDSCLVDFCRFLIGRTMFSSDFGGKCSIADPTEIEIIAEGVVF